MVILKYLLLSLLSYSIDVYIHLTCYMRKKYHHLCISRSGCVCILTLHTAVPPCF